jgi:hypothetical protein
MTSYDIDTQQLNAEPACLPAVDAGRTVRLASIYQPQIEVKFITTPGGQTNILFNVAWTI